uniref:Uncharacterized protein n=1 Tax=Arundo donax TaxID=35708 RepID=A0A0A9HD49_ARUDO
MSVSATRSFARSNGSSMPLFRYQHSSVSGRRNVRCRMKGMLIVALDWYIFFLAIHSFYQSNDGFDVLINQETAALYIHMNVISYPLIVSGQGIFLIQ